MAHHKSAKKRIRTSTEARLRNRRDRSRIRSLEKAVMGLTDKSKAQTELVQAYGLFDHMADKGLIHRSTAARHKAKLARHVNGLST